MIRFSCPGCEATFNVGDEKAGKTGKCPKCSAQFTIPLAQGGQEGASPVPPPPVATGGAVEIDPCPKCGARLSVEAGDIGLEVECPTCRAVYPAEAASTARPRNPDAGGSGKKLSLVKRDEEGQDERPSRRRREVARDEEDEDERPSRRGRRDDERDERPRRRRRSGRASNLESKRMPAALLAFFLGGFGVHKFYLGYTTPGLVMLLTTILGYIGGCSGIFCLITLPLFLGPCITGVIAFIEFIVYLTKSDEEFIDTYQVGQKEWF